MSVIIKNMDKPKTCWDCVKHFDIECNGNMHDCPIVEVDDRKTEPTISKMEQVDEPQTEYERASEQREHDILYEPTYNPEDGCM